MLLYQMVSRQSPNFSSIKKSQIYQNDQKGQANIFKFQLLSLLMSELINLHLRRSQESSTDLLIYASEDLSGQFCGSRRFCGSWSKRMTNQWNDLNLSLIISDLVVGPGVAPFLLEQIY